VRQGLLDALLVRPMSVLGQLLALDFTLRRLSRIAVAALVLAIAVPRAGIEWSITTAGLIGVSVLSGAVLFGAIFVGLATVAFWWIDSGEFANAFTYGGRDFTAYPITVYNGLFRGLFAFGLGFAFVAYYPTLVLLGRPDPLGLPAWTGWSAPAVAAIAVVLAGLTWRWGIRHYRSTGS